MLSPYAYAFKFRSEEQTALNMNEKLDWVINLAVPVKEPNAKQFTRMQQSCHKQMFSISAFQRH